MKQVPGKEKIESKSFGRPNEVAPFPKGTSEIVRIGDTEIGRLTFERGWSWAKSIKPSVKTKSCQVLHLFYHLSGTLKVVTDGGAEKLLKAGNISLIPPGHNAWVVGEESVEVLDLSGLVGNAKTSANRSRKNK